MIDSEKFRFEDLEVYQRAVDFANKIFELTNNWPRSNTLALVDQLRRSALSISLNIAEGSSRSKKEFARFLDIARGSCYESVPILEIAFKQKLIDSKQKEELSRDIVTIAKMISGLKNSLKPH